jgi:hypothetical protein
LIDKSPSRANHGFTGRVQREFNTRRHDWPARHFMSSISEREMPMALAGTIYLYRSIKSKGLFCFSAESKPDGLPQSLSPWRRFGEVSPAEKLPHGLQRNAIAPGMRENGYQLYRKKPSRSEQN